MTENVKVNISSLFYFRTVIDSLESLKHRENEGTETNLMDTI